MLNEKKKDVESTIDNFIELQEIELSSDKPLSPDNIKKTDTQEINRDNLEKEEALRKKAISLLKVRGLDESLLNQLDISDFEGDDNLIEQLDELEKQVLSNKPLGGVEESKSESDYYQINTAKAAEEGDTQQFSENFNKFRESLQKERKDAVKKEDNLISVSGAAGGGGGTGGMIQSKILDESNIKNYLSNDKLHKYLPTTLKSLFSDLELISKLKEKKHSTLLMREDSDLPSEILDDDFSFDDLETSSNTNLVTSRPNLLKKQSHISSEPKYFSGRGSEKFLESQNALNRYHSSPNKFSIPVSITGSNPIFTESIPITTDSNIIPSSDSNIIPSSNSLSDSNPVLVESSPVSLDSNITPANVSNIQDKTNVSQYFTDTFMGTRGDTRTLSSFDSSFSPGNTVSNDEVVPQQLSTELISSNNPNLNVVTIQNTPTSNPGYFNDNFLGVQGNTSNLPPFSTLFTPGNTQQSFKSTTGTPNIDSDQSLLVPPFPTDLTGQQNNNKSNDNKVRRKLERQKSFGSFGSFGNLLGGTGDENNIDSSNPDITNPGIASPGINSPSIPTSDSDQSLLVPPFPTDLTGQESNTGETINRDDEISNVTGRTPVSNIQDNIEESGIVGIQDERDSLDRIEPAQDVVGEEENRNLPKISMPNLPNLTDNKDKYIWVKLKAKPECLSDLIQNTSGNSNDALEKLTQND